MDTRKYLTIPYVFHGRSFEGCDCYGILYLYFREELGIEIDDFAGAVPQYDDYLKSNVMLENACLEWEEIPIGEVRKNDAVIIDSRTNGPIHCGVMISDTEILQTSSRSGPGVLKLSRVKHLIHSAYRHKRLL